MSFTVDLCVNKSETTKIGKSITVIASVSCTLKETTSIINPVFLFRGDYDFSQINYIKCEVFNRSYFINNIKSINNNLWEISCRVDVLESFKEQILNNTVITQRQENDWNLFLNDNSFRCYQNPHIIQKEFPHGFTPSASTFVLLVAGKPHETQQEE